MADTDRSSLRQALRILRRLMEGKVLSVRDIVAESALGSDAVRRHLALLEEEIPGVVREGRWGGTWRYDPATSRRDDPYALLGVALATGLLSALDGSEIHDRLIRLTERESARRGDADAGSFRRMFFAKSHMIGPMGVSPEGVDRLALAIYESRQMGAAYEFFDGTLDRIVLEPYSLIFADEGIYVYGRCVTSERKDHAGKLKLYNAGRFRGLRALDQRFAYPPPHEYDPSRMFRDLWGIFMPEEASAARDVVLRFHPRWAPYLRKQKWHESQTFPVAEPDGWARVSFHLHLTHDLARWIRGMGTNVQVVEPAELRARVEREVAPPSTADRAPR